MHRLHRNSRGLAEIVGTLLLVLIVVAAAAAFSIFVASYEAQLTAAEKAAHTRSLEDIRILSVSTVSNGVDYTSLSFVAGSLDINTMVVNELSINGQYINYFTVTPLGSSSTLDVCALCTPSTGTAEEFNLTPLEQVTITVSLTLWNVVTNPTGGFLNPYTLATAGPTNYISIDVYTTLGNDFTRTFDAPTAVAVTEQSEIYTGAAYQPVVVFDGSQSIVPANDTIVSWSWSIDDAAGVTCLELTGEKALFPQIAIPYGTYIAVLTVADANGLVSTATIPYSSTVTSPAIMACSTQGPMGSSTSLIGTGFSAGTVTATFAGGPITFTGCSPGQGTLDSTMMIITPDTSGGFDCQFTVPSSSIGDQTIQATDSSLEATPTATFIVTLPTLVLAPVQGPTGTTVAASGSGFTPGVQIGWSISAGASITSASFCAASATGSFGDCTFTINSLTTTAYTVTGTGMDVPADASDMATAQFTVVA